MTVKKKAGFYNPYLNTLGGGERYTLTFADCLSKNGYQVDVFWDDELIKRKIKERLGIKIEHLNFVSNIFKKGGKMGKKELRSYDLVFFLSDGSIPFLASKQNILHFQVPFHGVHGRSLLNRIKMMRISDVICNSFFTKKFIDREYGVNSKVVYPPVAVDSFKPLAKENIIISVGRFTDLLHNKRQDVLVEVFKKMKIKDWKLIIVGGDEEGKRYVADLKKKASGFPIEIITNPRFNDLKRLYGQAKIFWTAAGFGVDEEKEPEKVEHFGITTVEAMAAGCVSVVIKKGGQPEIVSEAKNGLLWTSEEELIAKTLRIIDNQKEWQKLSAAAQRRAKDFSQERFCEEIQKLLNK
ncbi:glycosyltransferase family 4 protein [Patescibacteria group bacterium]|nr:glycosyltransferase family 4 protein [Patescibacteria group bacterium]